MAELLVESGASVNTIDFTELRPLLSNLADQEQMVKWLISEGVNLSFADNEDGLTILHLAAMKGMNASEIKTHFIELTKNKRFRLLRIGLCYTNLDRTTNDYLTFQAMWQL